MKLFIVLSCFVACALANDLGYGGHYAAPAIVSKVVNVNNGHSTQYRKQDLAGNYAFGYDEQHHDGWGSGGSSRDETGDAWGNKQGSYSLNVGDGRQRVVKYVADGAGFRASIKTNEPGIVASNPADANINTPHSYDAVAAPSHVATAAYGHGGLALGNAYGAGLALNNGYGNGLALGNGYGAGLALNNGYGNAYGAGLALGNGYAGNAIY